MWAKINPIAMMRRYINMPLRRALPLLFVCAILLVSSMGCTSREETVKSVGNASSGAPSQSGAKVDVAVNSHSEVYQLGSGVAASTPQPGKKFAVFDVTVIDLSQKDLSVSGLFFKVTASDGTVASESSATFFLPNAFSGATLQPGEKLTGVIAFEIPQSTTATKLTYDDYSNRVTINL